MPRIFDNIDQQLLPALQLAMSNSHRGIPLALVQAVMDRPEQRLVDGSRTGRWIYQSRLMFNDEKIYLLRVVVDEHEEPPAIITAYRTSRIAKYWSTE